MGRLSAYAKNQILRLRFQKHNKITQIVKTLTKEDIKISRQSVSTFLKKYLETDSIHDKPRSGRKRKLTTKEIDLIGEITKRNPNITARAIKDCLELNVSTYTILRASKLFEWNKINPNSNEAKKAAAIERELRGERKRKNYSKKVKRNLNSETSKALTVNTSFSGPSGAASSGNQSFTSTSSSMTMDTLPSQTNIATAETNSTSSCLQIINVNQIAQQEQHTNGTNVMIVNEDDCLYDLKLINERELLSMRNTACSPMSFATKVLFKIYSVDELHGHNVSGKTFHKHIVHKEPLEEKRLMYIKWLVEKYFYYPHLANEVNNIATSVSSSSNNNNNSSSNFVNDNNINYYQSRDVLWKACCNAINKMIRRSEVNQIKAQEKQKQQQQQQTLPSNGQSGGTYHTIILNDNQENLLQQQQQQSNYTGIDKFNQLTAINSNQQQLQYLLDDQQHVMNGSKNATADSSSSFIDEIELVPQKRTQIVYNRSVQQDDDDSDSEIELLNETKLKMNITKSNLNINSISNRANSIVVTIAPPAVTTNTPIITTNTSTPKVKITQKPQQQQQQQQAPVTTLKRNVKSNQASENIEVVVQKVNVKKSPVVVNEVIVTRSRRNNTTNEAPQPPPPAAPVSQPKLKAAAAAPPPPPVEATTTVIKRSARLANKTKQGESEENIIVNKVTVNNKQSNPTEIKMVLLKKQEIINEKSGGNNKKKSNYYYDSDEDDEDVLVK